MPYPKIFPSSKIKVNYCCKGVVKQFLECKTKDTTFFKRAFTARFFIPQILTVWIFTMIMVFQYRFGSNQFCAIFYCAQIPGYLLNG